MKIADSYMAFLQAKFLIPAEHCKQTLDSSSFEFIRFAVTDLNLRRNVFFLFILLLQVTSEIIQGPPPARKTDLTFTFIHLLSLCLECV